MHFVNCIFLLLFSNLLLFQDFQTMWCATCAPFEPFFGDMSLDQYIEKFICQQEATKWSFVYVHQFQPKLNKTSLKNTKLNFHFHFNKHLLQCFTAVYYDQMNISQLSANLKAHFQHTEILTVFNVPSSSSDLLAQTLTALNLLYIECNRCLPFLLLLPQNPTPLKCALVSAKLNSTFPLRAVFATHLSTFHLNPVLDGCSQQNGLFKAQTEHDFSRLKSTLCSLNNSELNVTVNEEAPFCQIVFQNAQKTKITFGRNFLGEVAILEALQRQFHFRSRLIYGRQIYAGQYNHSSQLWEGSIGHVYSRRSQLAVCGLSIGYHRQQMIDYTTHTQWDSFAFLTRHPLLHSRAWLALVPFSTVVWVLIAGSFATLLLTTFFIQYSLFPIFNKQNHFLEEFADNADILFRMLLKSSTTINNPQSVLKMTVSIRFIFGFWLLITLVLSTAYSAIFYSVLTVPKVDPPVDTIEQFLEYINENKQMRFISSDYQYNLLKNADPENRLYRLVGERFPRSSYVITTTTEDFLPYAEEIQSGRLTTFVNRAYFLSLVHNYGFKAIGHISRESVNVDALAMALPKRSPLLKPFNFAIQQLHERGLVEHFFQRSLWNKLPYKSDNEKVQKYLKKQEQLEAQQAAKPDHDVARLGLADLQSVFVLAALGTLLSTMTFTIEFYLPVVKIMVFTLKNKTAE